MLQAAIALLGIAALTAMSLRANQRFKGEDRLPMQWWLDGSVNWTAPRQIALAFTPVLGTFCLLGAAALTTLTPPRTGQEGLVIPANIAMAVVFVGAHAFHLWMIERTIHPRH